jgi:hypothetical protein
VAFGTAGCTFFTDQATTQEVETSDGVNANLGDVSIRNATLISEDGQTASLLVSFLNNNLSTLQLSIQYTDAKSGKVTQNVYVDGTKPGAAATTITSFGASGQKQIVLNNINSQPGSLFPVFFQYGNQEGQQVLVPVLNTTLPQYTGLAPSSAPTGAPLVTTPATGVPSTSTATPTPTPTP